jgi:GDP-mannose 6-dehydrogenase
MKVIVIGLGHIGVVTVAALVRDGHAVIGVDTDDEICRSLTRGVSSFREPGVQDLIASGHAAARLTVASTLGDAADAYAAFVCVGTKGLPGGLLDLSDVTLAARALGEAVRLRPPELAPMLMVFRSTMLPGSMRRTVLPAVAAAAGEPPGTRYEIAYGPEFTREGTALADTSPRRGLWSAKAGHEVDKSCSTSWHRGANFLDLVRGRRAHEACGQILSRA